MCTVTEDSQTRKKTERKEEILHAAVEIFAKKGFKATKVSDIASKADLSYGLIYHYFESKESIFIELLDYALEVSLGVFKLASNSKGSPEDKLKNIIHMIIPRAYQGIGAYFFLIVVEAYKSDSVPLKAKEMVKETGLAYRKYLTPIIENGQDKGQIIEGDPAQITTVLLSLIQGLSVMSLQGKEPEIPEPELVLNMFLV